MSFDVVTGASKEDLVSKLSATCIDHELVGDTLWGIRENLSGKIIVCFSLAANEDGWGYTEICESKGPVSYSCPLRFLKGTVPMSIGWRLSVMYFHKKKL